MSNTMQHHHVTLTPRPDKVEETRQLLLDCALKVAQHKGESGPISWWSSFDEEKQVFYVDALFPGQDAVKFHQENIQAIVKSFGACMAAPPETLVRTVFASAS